MEHLKELFHKHKKVVLIVGGAAAAIGLLFLMWRRRSGTAADGTTAAGAAGVGTDPGLVQPTMLPSESDNGSGNPSTTVYPTSVTIMKSPTGNPKLHRIIKQQRQEARHDQKLIKQDKKTVHGLKQTVKKDHKTIHRLRQQRKQAAPPKSHQPAPKPHHPAKNGAPTHPRRTPLKHQPVKKVHK